MVGEIVEQETVEAVPMIREAVPVVGVLVEQVATVQAVPMVGKVG